MSTATRVAGRVLKAAALVLAGLLVLLLVVALTLGLVARSERGTAWLVDTAVSRFVAEGRVSGVQGSLTRGVVIEELGGAFGDVTVELDRLEARWQWTALLRSRIHVNYLVVDGLEVGLPPGNDEPPPDSDPLAWPSLVLPVEIQLDRIQLTDTLIRMGEQEHRIHYAGLVANLNPRRLEIGELHVQYEDIDASLHGRVATRFPYDSELRIGWLLEGADVWSGRGRLWGSVEQFELEHRLTGQALVDTRGSVTTGVDRELIRVEIEALDAELTNRVRVTDLNVDGLDDAVNASLRLDVAGRPQQWQVTLDGRAEMEGYPALDIDLLGAGDLEQFNLERLLLGDGSGRLEATGDARWTPGLSARLTLDIHELELSPWVPEADLALDGQVLLAYRDEEGVREAEATLNPLEILYDGLPIAATGRATWQPERMGVEGLRVTAAENHLELDGHYYATGDLSARWNLTAPDLGLLGDDWSGQITSTGRLEGSLEEPRIELRAEGRGLSFGDIRIDALDLDGQPHGGALQHRVELTVDGLQSGETRVDRVAAHLTGSPERHRLEATANMAEERVELAVAGGYRDERWRGEVASLALTVRELGHWAIAAPAGLEVGADLLVLDPLCLSQAGWRRSREERGDSTVEVADRREQGETDEADNDSPVQREARRERREPSRLCVQVAQRGDDDLRLQASLERFPLHRFNHYWPIGTGIRGWLDGTAEATLTDGGPVWEASLVSAEGHLLYAELDDEIETIPYRDLRLSTRGDARRWQVAAGFDLPGQGGLALDLSILPEENQRLEGQLEGRFSDLSWLDMFANPVSDITGELLADLDVQGTLQQPQVRGRVQLTDLAAYVAPLGIHLGDGQFDGQLSPHGLWTLNGGVNMGSGRLRLESTLDLADPSDWRAEFAAAGSRLLVIDTPEIHSLASPDIRGTLTPERGVINGRIGLAETRIRLEELPAGQQTIVVSDDVVIHPVEDDVEAVPPYNLIANIEVVIEDEVDFEGYGLSARAEGGINLVYRTDRPLTAEGRVALTEGRYRAYGQNLAIERGEVYFSGPLDNPAIDIRAARTARGMTAGIQLGGRVQSITSSIYSDPPMAPSDAMAFLLTGRPLSGASQEEANMLVNAVASLGIEHGEVITGGIESAFGLDTFAIEGGDTLQDTALVVGKNLTPRLLISYSEKLFERTSSVTLSYELTRRTTLQAESGEGQSLDVIFRDEFGR